MSISKTRVGGLVIAGGMVLLASADVALGFPWPPTVTDPGAITIDASNAHDQSPQIATDGLGRWFVVFYDATTRTIAFSNSTNNGRAWSAPVGLSNGFEFSPAIATDGAGNLVVVWVGGGTIQVTRSSDHGATWAAQATLSSVSGSSAPHLATDGTGAWVAVWRSTNDLGGTIGTDPDVLVSRSTDNGATWTAAAALNPNAGTDVNPGADFKEEAPRIATNASGTWLTVWRAWDDGNLPDGIFASSSTDAGATWSIPTRVDPPLTATVIETPDVSTDGLGNWLVVWISNALGDFDIFVSQSTNAGATWSAQTRIDNNAAETDRDDQPRIVTDGAGNWVAVWANDVVTPANRDIWFSVSTDDGATWCNTAPLNNNAPGPGNHNTSPALATDGADNWVGVWVSKDFSGTFGSDDDILFARFRSADPVCGDAILNSATGETCDPPGEPVGASGNICRVDCTVCGDGNVDVGEECDDGNSVDNDGCHNDCTLPICGNNVMEQGEECDGTDDSACPGDCTGDCDCAVCGDNVTEGAEQCDGTDDSACPGDCTSDCDCAVCGDNVAEGTEQCDGTDADACPTLCTVLCVCPVPVCGNNVSEVGEECDGTSDAACPGNCSADCDCAVCGDNVAEGLEVCDGTDDTNCPGSCKPNCDCPAAAPPLPEAPIVVEKTRYVTFIAQNAGRMTALELTLKTLPNPYDIWNNMKMFVTGPEDVSELPGVDGPLPLPNFKTAHLRCTPDCRDWGALGRIDLRSEAIQAGSTYELRAVDCQSDLTDPANYSAALPLSTSQRADVVGAFLGTWPPPDGVTDVHDLVSVLESFTGIATASRKARTDIMGNCVNLKVDIFDVVEIIEAFRGLPSRVLPSSPDPCMARCP